MRKFYLVYENDDETDDYFLFSSLHLAVRFIQEEELDNFILTNEPFLDEQDKAIPIRLYKFIG